LLPEYTLLAALHKDFGHKTHLLKYKTKLVIFHAVQVRTKMCHTGLSNSMLGNANDKACKQVKTRMDVEALLIGMLSLSGQVMR
jgi:hypothetical protein